jgi:hypothetical protein
MDRGQHMAGAVAICGLLLSATVGIFGSAWASGIIAIVSIGGPTAAVWLARGAAPPKPKAPATSAREAPKRD